MNNTAKTLSVGQELKRIREQRGWSLQAASKVTRIRSDQLELIEQDRLEEFPSQSYVRGFIRIYSKALGLNPDIVMDHVEKRPDKKNLSHDEDTLYLDLEPNTRNMEAVVGLDDRAQEWGAKLVAALVALVIIALIAVIYQTMQNANPSPIAGISRDLANEVAVDDTPLPVIPRERLLTQNRQPLRTESSVVAPAAPVATRLTPLPTTTQIETPVLDHPSPKELPVLRPGRVIKIPGTENTDNLPPAQNTNQPTTDTLHSTDTNNHDLAPITIPGEMPVRHATVVTPTNNNNQNNTDFANATGTTQQADIPFEEFVILDETPLPEEEVTLSDEQFLQLEQQTASVAHSAPPAQRTVTNGPLISGSRGAVPRAIPILPVRTNTSRGETQPAQPDSRNNTNTHPDTSVGPANPSDAANPPRPLTDTSQPISSTHTTPSADNFGDALNQLRLELSKEAYVRVFINDTAGNPTLDEVLPAGSAASWEGRTFYVTIRPANAATFYYNGLRYDYSGRGPENVTLRFP